MARGERDNRDNIYTYRITETSMGYGFLAGSILALGLGHPEIGIPAFLVGLDLLYRAHGNEQLEKDNQTRELRRAQGWKKLISPLDLQSYRAKRQRDRQAAVRR